MPFSASIKSSFVLSCGLVCLAGRAAAADKAAPPPTPVPRMQAIPLPDHQISFQRDGRELARYYYGPELRRPFVFPVLGPSGWSLTRMGHPHDPESHSHHNSVWISHHDVNGISFWEDRGKGRVVHQRIESFEDSPAAAAVVTVNAWTDDRGKVLLHERRRTETRPLAKGEWLLLIDLQLEAGNEAVVLGKTPFGLIGVRMAKTIGVNDGGGLIRNSQGAVNETDVLWKRARWVDYSGPMTPSASEGITLMDHPANPNHPAFFHVRNDGWMGVSLTYDAPRAIQPNRPLRLRYGLYIHAGIPAAKQIDRQWNTFAGQPLAELRPGAK